MDKDFLKTLTVKQLRNRLATVRGLAMSATKRRLRNGGKHSDYEYRMVCRLSNIGGALWSELVTRKNWE